MKTPRGWRCICGNTPLGDGFFPCNESGNEMEPAIGSGWTDLYVCARCGRIIKQPLALKSTLHTLTNSLEGGKYRGDWGFARLHQHVGAPGSLADGQIAHLHRFAALVL
jgi:hypothetical protein